MKIRIHGFDRTKKRFGTAPDHRRFRGVDLEADFDEVRNLYRVRLPEGPLHVHPADVKVIQHSQDSA